MAGDNLFAAMRAPQDYAIFSAKAAANAVDSTFFIAGRRLEVTGVREIHATAGGSGAAVVVKKDTGTGAPVSGNSVMASASFDLTATANTLQTSLPSATEANRILNAGDRLSVDFSGTVTGLADCVVVVSLKPVQG